MPTPSNATPTTVVVRVNEYLEMQINGCKEYTFYINGQEYKELPLDANVREPDTKKSKPYKDMLKTLSEHPEHFFENNLGISVIAKDVQQLTNKKFKITFPSGTGILNGGHTQRAILDSQSDPDISKAIVRVTVRVKDYEAQRIAQIASAQNSTTSVKEYSLAEKKGLFADLKLKLSDDYNKHIVWWEGKSVAANKGMEPVDLIALINLFNIDLYSSPYARSTMQPYQSATSKASVFRKWETEDNIPSYKKIYPLVNDIIDLYELIQLRFADRSGMGLLTIIKESKGKAKELTFSMETPQFDLPKQLLLPLLAAYRANVYYDAANRKIGWHEDNAKLFQAYNKELCEKLRTAFKAARNDPTAFARNSIYWETLYTTLQSHIDTTKVFKTYDI